jgi:hypothetical protein
LGGGGCIPLYRFHVGKSFGVQSMVHTLSVIKTDQLMLTEDIMPVLRMREKFLIHSVGKYKDFLILV